MKKRTKHAAVLEKFANSMVNTEFWNRFFAVEQMAEMEMDEDERFVITSRNNFDGEENRYQGIRLKKTVRAKH
jgi:hypothetical protein